VGVWQAPLAHAAPSGASKIGHTSITWGSNAAAAEPGIKTSPNWATTATSHWRDARSLELKGGLGRISTENNMPLPPLTST